MLGFSWLTSKIAAGGAIVVAVLAAVAKIFYEGKQRGKNQAEAEEAKRSAKDLERIRNAGNAKPRGSVHNDPNNRDTWK